MLELYEINYPRKSEKHIVKFGILGFDLSLEFLPT